MRQKQCRIRGHRGEGDVIDGDVETGSVMAGQSVGMVKQEQSIAEILAELVAQAENALKTRS